MQATPAPIVKNAARHLLDILTTAIQHTETQTAIVLFDRDSPLAITLTAAYRECLQSATFIDFNATAPDDILAALKTLSPGDLVVLIPSNSFRINDFRMRVELFEKKLKVIEHPRLARMPAAEIPCYIDSLAYDVNYYHTIGHALKNRIDKASRCMIESGGEELIFAAPLEPAKLNIGDYTGMNNIGGQFPIGEVFTEAQDLETVHGRVRIFAFADNDFMVNIPEQPITLIVTAGRITDVVDSTPAFDLVLEKIRRDENEIWLRELGFGMNRAFTPTRTVSDIGTYERMCGVHLSIGAKHSVYKKPQFKRKTTWHHVDVFVVTEKVYMDDTLIFEKDGWQV